MRTNRPHIFAIGGIISQPMLAHKAAHEEHVAAEVIAGELQGDKELASAAFNARVISSLANTDPEVAWVCVRPSRSASVRSTWVTPSVHEVLDTDYKICHDDTLSNAWGTLRELNPAQKPVLAGCLVTLN